MAKISKKEAHAVFGELGRRAKLYSECEEALGLAIQAEDDLSRLQGEVVKKQAEVDGVSKKYDATVLEVEEKSAEVEKKFKAYETTLDMEFRDKTEDINRRTLALDHTLAEIEKTVVDSNVEKQWVVKDNARAIEQVKGSYRTDVDKLVSEKKGLEDRVTGLRAELDKLVSKVVGAAA